MPAQAAARVKTPVLAIGRRDFVECKCRLVGYRRAEPARAELGHNSAEIIRQDTQARLHTHGVQTQEAEMLIQALIVANGRATVSREEHSTLVHTYGDLTGSMASFGISCRP